ncbi:hypothetical protein S40288_10226 [Stachybotrys chartarum IBT 40288]|nr:hypothetical protein S40288_10226 [Stachybotrys chartarum IBT 40288]
MEIAASSSSPEERAVLEAARNGDEETLKEKLGIRSDLLWTKEHDTGRTLLHLAIQSNHDTIVKLLLEKGANPEVGDSAGWKPLAVAARNGPSHLGVAELVLSFGANVDSLNPMLQQSALHLCANSGFRELAQLLLKNRAQVDVRDTDGQTPLFKAVAQGTTGMVELLLQYGAVTNVRSTQGVTLMNLASNDPDVLRILQSAPLQHGPKVSKKTRRQKVQPRVQTLIALNPTPAGDLQKITACYAFKATVTNFYIGDTEQRVQRSIPVYDVLYGRGADAIMRTGQNDKIPAKPSFRWYHFPANNMEWVEAFVRRHFSERSPRTGQYTDDLAGDLGMRRTRHDHHLIFTSKGSFIRPFCRKVMMDVEQSDSRVGRYIGAFVPYLHYETNRDFNSMSKIVSEAMGAWAARLGGPTHTRRRENTAGSGHGEQQSPVPSNASGGSERDLPRRPNNNATNGQGASSGLLQKLLIEAYMKTDANNDVPPLQIRRSLDHYSYSHLASTSRRDADQVVFRYTSEFVDVEPKMFMVDQLWLWVLDDDTVISCCPMRWDSWTIGPSTGGVGDQRFGPGNMGTGAPTSWDDFMLRENDPLNIEQAITGHIRKLGRDSINNVEDLCRVIAAACLSAFDHYAIPYEYHFFDFVERAIGDVIDQIAERFQGFQALLDAAAASDELLSAASIRIERETKLLVEIEDIRDELGIMRLVLEDQMAVAKDLDKLLYIPDPDDGEDNKAGGKIDYELASNRVLTSHLARIGRMEALAKRAIQSIRSLLKLKQQHASVSEAQSSRRQAEYTSNQVSIGTSYNRKVARQLELARKQAEATSKQGRVILLFTVVTVVFLPLSFMTSFFTIELDVFPLNEDGRLGIGYVLGIILSVSAGVSIPFMLVAFNLEKVQTWPKKAMQLIRHTRTSVNAVMGAIIVGTLVALAVVLSQPLGEGIRAGIGLVLGLMAVVAIATIIGTRYNWGERKNARSGSDI